MTDIEVQAEVFKICKRYPEKRYQAIYKIIKKELSDIPHSQIIQALIVFLEGTKA